MNLWTRLLRTLGAAAVAASFVLAGGFGNLALANGEGDLYVANGQVVDEVHTVNEAIVNKLPDVSSPSLLAFSPGGERLYVANGTATVTAINISDLSVQGRFDAPGKVVAMAYPSGGSLYVAVQGSKKLSVLAFTSTGFVDGPTFGDAPDLLAASPVAAELAAAKKGAGWISILHPSDMTQTQVAGGSSIGGTVVDLAIARGEGYLWFATTGSGAGDKLVRQAELSTGRIVHKTAPLPGAPAAVAAMGNFAVAAVGKTLYKVVGNSASKWATAPGTVTAIAADQTATVLYAATGDSVVAYTSKDQSKPIATVKVSSGKPLSLAPVPNKASSVAPAAGGATASGRPGASGHSATTGTAKPRKTHAPSTDTVVDFVGGGPGTSLVTVIGVLVAIVVSVTLGSRYVIKRLVGE